MLLTMSAIFLFDTQECVKPESVDDYVHCNGADTRVQTLPEPNLIEIARHSNPVVQLEKMGIDKYGYFSVDLFICIGIYFMFVFLTVIRIGW